MRAYEYRGRHDERHSAPPGRLRRAFTLAELLVVVTVLAVLLALAMPSLRHARRAARTTVCLQHLREFGHGLHMYAGENGGRALPLAYTDRGIIGDGPEIYWWGTNGAEGVDRRRGFLWPYLREHTGRGSVWECPAQPPGSYEFQGRARQPTSTYGYNGYYLCPPHTPGWAYAIGHRPWRRLAEVRSPQTTLAFADTLIDLGGSRPFNNALLDPPYVFERGRWRPNAHPTTAFRHAGRACGVYVDGHAEASGLRGGRLVSRRFRIGYMGRDNAPYYVPDWSAW